MTEDETRYQGPQGPEGGDQEQNDDGPEVEHEVKEVEHEHEVERTVTEQPDDAG